MSAYEVLGHTKDRSAWLDLRRQGIGASDAAGVLAASPWSSPVSVFADKVAPQPEDNPPERLYWGRVLEPIIIRHYERETGRQAERDGRLLRSKARPWQLCTLDGIQYRDGSQVRGTLEIKNTRVSLGGGVPEHYWIQMQHQFAVTGYEWGSFAALVMGCEFVWCDVKRDDDFIQNTLIPAEEAFWKRVEAGGPTPPTDGSEATRLALTALFPDDSGESVVLPREYADLTIEREGLADEIAQLEARKREIDNQVRAEIGDASMGVLTDGRAYTYKTNKNGVRTLRAPKPGVV